MKRSVIAAAVFLTVLACSKTEPRVPGPGPVQNAPAAIQPAGSSPVIVSASLYPENATARSQLIARYRLGNPEETGASATVRWYVDNAVVQEGQLQTLEPAKHFKGSEVYAEITPTNSAGPGKPFRTETLRIANIPPDVTSISLTPDRPSVDATVTAVAEGADADNDSISFRYQWFVNGVAASEPGENSRFSTMGLRKQDQVAVVVTAFDGTAAGPAKQSDILVLVNSAPRITSTPATTAPNGVYSYQVAAADPDGDKLTFTLVKAPEGMAVNTSTGLIRWTPPASVQRRQEIPIGIKVDDGDGGSFVQEYSLILTGD